MDFQSLLNALTSDRLKEGNLIFQSINEVLMTSPYFGYGFGYSEYSDFAFYEVISISGLFGLTLYLLIFIYIFAFSIYHIFKGSKEALLLFFIWLLLIFSSIGAPILTANRISIIIWILTSLLIFLISKKEKEDRRELN